MKHIILFLFVLLALISCVKEEEDSPLLSAPVITLKEESSIYKTKIGREITIAPIYENTDSETTFNWTIDGKSICTASTLTFSADEAGRYFILISATNAGGTTERRYVSMSFNLMYLLSLLRMPTKVSKCFKALN